MTTPPTNSEKPYPVYVCHDCGSKYGKRRALMSTFHRGTCGVCGKEKSVTEPRDYGSPKFPNS